MPTGFVIPNPLPFRPIKDPTDNHPNVPGNASAALMPDLPGSNDNVLVCSRSTISNLFYP